jgi:hypothetical protein
MARPHDGGEDDDDDDAACVIDDACMVTGRRIGIELQDIQRQQ